MSDRDPRKKFNLKKYKVGRTTFKSPVLRNAKITKRMLEILGEEMVRGVREEASRASGLGTGIPSTSEFLDSFGYEIVGGDSIRITSDWKWVSAYLKARVPFKMTWLTQQNGAPKIIPLKDKNGDIVFRTTPLRLSEAWVHPAIYKYNFIDKGIKRGVARATPRILFEMSAEVFR